jgi:hypothetical protein
VTQEDYSDSPRENPVWSAVTDDFTSGQIFKWFAPFFNRPLEYSSNLAVLFHVGDAQVSSTLPGAAR